MRSRLPLLGVALLVGACSGHQVLTKKLDGARGAFGSPGSRGGSPQTQPTRTDNGSEPGPTTVPGTEDAPIGTSSYLPVVTEPFDVVRARLVAQKDEVEARQKALLELRYDMSDKPSTTTMFRGKPLQAGVRVRLKEGTTWADLAAMRPEQIKERDLFPAGFLPLPHVNQKEGGQVFPQFHIDEIQRQEGRDLKRFDVDHDFPDYFLPEFPPAIFLTPRPDLGDTSQGKLVTNKNFFELYNGILTPNQLDGLRLLVTPFAQQQFNVTGDRRVETPQLGVTCFDCHANGHTNGAMHLDPQTRPEEVRRRLDTPTLRGVSIQRLFGGQRALKTVEDFTQFEQIGAYFDGDFLKANQKGANILNRDFQVNHMAEFQELLDFPPAPKLDVTTGKLDPTLATAEELHGQEVFFGKGQCAGCHAPPFYTDNLMHDLKVERFYKTQMINGRLATAEGLSKTFPLRGIKESPPYLHDGRLLTLEDTVEFFNLVLGTKLSQAEKADLAAFMKAL